MEEFFKKNPRLKVIYITSDGTKFYQEVDARSHAKTLEDKSVEPVYNKAHLTVNEEVNVSDEAKQMAEFEASKAALVPEVVVPEVVAPEVSLTVVTTEKSGTVELSELTKAGLNEFAALNELTIANTKATNEKLVEEIMTQLNAKKVQ